MTVGYRLRHGDCLKVMKLLPDESIDFILCDLPYGTTACEWDSVIPFKPLWRQYKRIIKRNGVIALFGSEPFSSVLRVSNIDWFKYDWIWEKSKPTGHVHSKNKPMKKHEIISIFSRGVTLHEGQSTNKMPYYPQGLVSLVNPATRKNYDGTSDAVMAHRKSSQRNITRWYTNYPLSIIRGIRLEHNTVHPTQKPVLLAEYLIKTYTREGNVVLDNCMGSGTVGVACMNIGRRFFGIEQDDKYYDIARARIAEAKNRAGMSLFK